MKLSHRLSSQKPSLCKGLILILKRMWTFWIHNTCTCMQSPIFSYCCGFCLRSLLPSESCTRSFVHMHVHPEPPPINVMLYQFQYMDCWWHLGYDNLIIITVDGTTLSIIRGTLPNWKENWVWPAIKDWAAIFVWNFWTDGGGILTS